MNIPGRWRIERIMSHSNLRGAILLYHRIANLKYDPWQLSVTPDNFAEHLRVLRKYCHLVKINEMAKGLKNLSLGRKKVAITFDDDYVDIVFNAKPILENHNIAATFFITTGLINSREEFWSDELEKIILEAVALPNTFELVIAGSHYRWRITTKGQEKLTYSNEVVCIPKKDDTLSPGRLYFVLWKIISGFSQQEKKEVLQKISQWSGELSDHRKTHLPMNTEELLSLAKCPLFEIGSHTVSHPMLSSLPMEQQREEINSSKVYLENLLNRQVSSFSYPHGDYSLDTVSLLKELKFNNACTVASKPVERSDSPYLLPRFSIFNWAGTEFERNLKRWLA
jgi:peptidoglycan/xylan/chitin deacetylase (PgdA/CDA1 family)